MNPGMQLRIAFLCCLAIPLSAQTMNGIPPVHRSGKYMVFAGADRDWPARLLALDHGKLIVKQGLGYPSVQGSFASQPVLWRDRLQVLDWNRTEGPNGPEVAWHLHERGLEAKDGWTVARQGTFPPKSKLKAMLPLEDPDTFLVVGWLYDLSGAGKNLPAHRVKVSAEGQVEVLESLGSEKDDLVQMLQAKRSALGELVIHGDGDGRWILLHPFSGLLWVVDGKGRHRHSFQVSAHVNAEAMRQKRAPMQVVIQSQPTEDGMLWIQARNEDCLEAASFQETRRTMAPPTSTSVAPPPPGGQGVPPVTVLEGNEAWRQEIDNAIRRHPRLRWIEFNPATGRGKDMATAPSGAVDVATTFIDLMTASRWIPGELGQVIRIPDALMPWGESVDSPKATEGGLPSKEARPSLGGVSKPVPSIPKAAVPPLPAGKAPAQANPSPNPS